jgi:hypothetical protein
MVIDGINRGFVVVEIRDAAAMQPRLRLTSLAGLSDSTLILQLFHQESRIAVPANALMILNWLLFSRPGSDSLLLADSQSPLSFLDQADFRSPKCSSSIRTMPTHHQPQLQ